MAGVAKEYPISSYIKCIRKLKIPYPEDGLRKFLSSYVENFTRNTSPNFIHFDGIEKVSIAKTSQVMTNEYIETMLMSMVAFHSKNTQIYKRFALAARELAKRPMPIISKKFEVSPKKPEEEITSIDLEMLQDVVEILNNDFETDDIDIPYISVDDVLKIAVTANLPINVVWQESDGREFIRDVWYEMHDKIVVYELASWYTLPEFGSITDPQVYAKEVASKLKPKETKPKTPKSIKSTKPKTLTLTDKIDNAAAEALALTLKNPIVKDNVKGMFKSLLFTHNTPLNVALNMFAGKYTFIRGVEKSTFGGIYPVGRGAQFRWGIDSQYGEVILVMKPDFWKKYNKGVRMDGFDSRIVDGVVFTDFWKPDQSGLPYQMTESEIIKSGQLQTEAKNFGFRDMVTPDKVNHCSAKDRPNLTWCNIQLHIGDNVDLSNVLAVLVPRYLLNVKEKWGGMDIPELIKSPTNPFHDRIIFYGPDDAGPPIGPHSHYSIALKYLKKRDPIYDKILKGYTVADQPMSHLEDIAVDKGLHRSRIGGHSSMIGLSQEAFVDAQKHYMYLLGAKGMGVD
jgi:hypothetical protein